MRHSRASTPCPRTLAVPAAFLLLTALALAPAAQAASRTFTQTFPADAPVRLANLAGAVELVAGSGDQVEVEATVYAQGEDAAETERLLSSLRWQESDDVLDEEGWVLSYPVREYRSFRYPGGDAAAGASSWLSRFFGGGSRARFEWEGRRVEVQGYEESGVPTLYADLRITVPAGTELVLRNAVGPVEAGELSGDLTIDTASGEVRVAGFDGPLSIDTGSGSVRTGRVLGPLHVDTGSGRVEVAWLEGDGSIDTGSGEIRVLRADSGELTLDTGSGDVFVSDARVGRLVADTGSGEIRLDAVEAEYLEADTGSGDVDVAGSLARTRRVVIDTGSGDVTLRVGADASFDLETDLGSGDLTVRYDDADLRYRDRELVGARRGDGRTRIHVDTGSGDCVISPGA